MNLEGLDGRGFINRPISKNAVPFHYGAFFTLAFQGFGWQFFKSLCSSAVQENYSTTL
jgi:hypothetical protein